MTSLPPFLIFFVAAAFVPLVRGPLRGALLLATPIIGAANLLSLDHGIAGEISVMGLELVLLKIDRLSFLFGLLFHLAALLGIIFSLHLRDTVQQVAGITYSGAAIGAVFAGDMLSLFVFWELLAVTSVFLILAQRTERAVASAMRYLVLQVVSGVILLAGVMVWYSRTGSIAFGYMGLDGLGAHLVFLAIGIKAAFPLLHNWLTDAYAEATPTGTVFLSAFTTKFAVYALARAFPGTEALIFIGGAMAVFPIFFAVIENDLRRVLSYSLINQVGFMVVGIGLGSELAINGAVSHAFTHIIYKALLFMSMGAVLFRTGKMNGSELGGLYKSMPFTAGFCIVGAASISAFPLFSGFISKSMVMVAALEEGQPVVWLALLFASAGVFHHAGIKIPFFAFFSHDSGIRVREAPINMLIAMGLAAALCIFLGSYPWPLYNMLPYPVDYAPYTVAHVLTQAQLLFFSALAFCWLKLSGLYPPELPGINIDAEWVYRRLLPRLTAGARAVGRSAHMAVFSLIGRRLDRFLETIFRHHGPQGILARTWPTGSTVLWIAVLLASTLLLYYL